VREQERRRSRDQAGHGTALCAPPRYAVPEEKNR
jgi:hypothetical protein